MTRTWEVVARENLLIDSYLQTTDRASFIPVRLSGRDCERWDVRNVRNEFAPFARILSVVDSRYIRLAVQIASQIRGSSRTTFLIPSVSLSLSVSPSLLPSLPLSLFLSRARSLSIPLLFPGSVCTASINIYNETRSSDCTPLPIWPESLVASAPVILGRFPAIFTKRGH